MFQRTWHKGVAFVAAFVLACSFVPAFAVSAYAAWTFEDGQTAILKDGSGGEAQASWDEETGTLTITLNGDWSNDILFKDQCLNAGIVDKTTSANFKGINKVIVNGTGNVINKDDSYFFNSLRTPTSTTPAATVDMSELDGQYLSEAWSIKGELILPETQKEVALAWIVPSHLSGGVLDLTNTSYERVFGVFNKMDTITAVKFPKTLKVLDASFEQAPLTSVEFADGTELESIGDDAFQSCGFLTSIELPYVVGTIGDNVFRNCTSLESVRMPFSIEIPEDPSETEGVFSNTNLKSITLTCAPSSTAVNESLKNAISDYGKVSNDLHVVSSASLSQNSSAECSFCGEQLALSASAFDEGNESYQTLVEAAGGRQILSTQAVSCDVEEFNGRSSKGTFMFHPPAPEGYTEGQTAKAILLYSDGTTEEKDTRDGSVSDETSTTPVLNFTTQKCPVAFAIVLEEQPVQQATVTFDSNEGSAVDSMTVDANSIVSKPADPTREGYTFTGWFTDEACTQAFDFATPITANITLYAGWEKEGTNPPVIDPSDDPTDDPKDSNAETEEGNETDNGKENPSKTTNAKTAATKASPKTGDENAALGMSLAGAVVALAALGGTLGYRRRRKSH